MGVVTVGGDCGCGDFGCGDYVCMLHLTLHDDSSRILIYFNLRVERMTSKQRLTSYAHANCMPQLGDKV